MFFTKQERIPTHVDDDYYGYSYDRYRTVKTTPKERMARFGALGLSIVAIAGAFHEDGLDILGDAEKQIPKSEAIAKNQAKYDKTFQMASPAGKFVLQYLRSSTVATAAFEGGAGPAAWFNEAEGDDKYVTHFNNGCLQRTAYDIAGGTIEGRLTGVFSHGEVDGDIPTAAAFAQIDPSNPNNLIVKSGHDSSVDLHFSGLREGSQLNPQDSATRNILETNGCKTGPLQTEIQWLGQSSEYISK